MAGRRHGSAGVGRWVLGPGYAGQFRWRCANLIAATLRRRGRPGRALPPPTRAGHWAGVWPGPGTARRARRAGFRAGRRAAIGPGASAGVSAGCRATPANIAAANYPPATGPLLRPPRAGTTVNSPVAARRERCRHTPPQPFRFHFRFSAITAIQASQRHIRFALRPIITPPFATQATHQLLRAAGYTTGRTAHYSSSPHSVNRPAPVCATGVRSLHCAIAR